jgi:glycosyltransferase involved in cell wall biosynthesis
MQGPEVDALERSVAERADCIYFLIDVGWKNELRANRWHYARRWARLLPVVLVVPKQSVPSWSIDEEAEPRLDNCSILNVVGPLASVTPPRMAIQIAQVLAHMRAHGLRRPILWCYNPHLVGVHGGVPAVARVFHATENYGEFGLTTEYERKWTTAIEISDLVVTVSSGVADAVRPHVRGALLESANGCDYREYATAEPNADLRTAGAAFSRIGIYAGNVNSRLDFGLLVEAARHHRDVLFALYGPVKLGRDHRAEWNRLLAEPNVRHFGPVDPDELPSLYHAADVGLIPYKQDPLIVNNGFPLKTMEMGATGLPVVSTLMKPIVGLADAILVARSNAEFVEGIGRKDRSKMTPAEREELRRLSLASDYDTRFREVLGALGQLPLVPTATTRLDDFAADMLVDLDFVEWKRELTRFCTPRVVFPLAYAMLVGLARYAAHRALTPVRILRGRRTEGS